MQNSNKETGKVNPYLQYYTSPEKFHSTENLSTIEESVLCHNNKEDNNQSSCSEGTITENFSDYSCNNKLIFKKSQKIISKKKIKNFNKKSKVRKINNQISVTKQILENKKQEANKLPLNKDKQPNKRIILDEDNVDASTYSKSKKKKRIHCKYDVEQESYIQQKIFSRTTQPTVEQDSTSDNINSEKMSSNPNVTAKKYKRIIYFEKDTKEPKSNVNISTINLPDTERNEEESFGNTESSSDIEDILDDIEKFKWETDDGFSVPNIIIPESDKRILENMKIKNLHNIPPQHWLGKGAENFRKEHKKSFEKVANLKLGPFSEKEDKIIIKNWYKFCKLYDWDKSNLFPFLYMKNESFRICKYNRRAFMQFLSYGLNERSISSVYQRFRVLFIEHKVSRYSLKEDNTIMQYMKNCKSRHKVTDLARILNRTKMSVWRRWQILKKS